jgi:pyrroline-5-carboxylate reductase
MAEAPQIGFLGAGKMATALARGWMAAGMADTDHIRASDPSAEARKHFETETGIPTATDNRDVVVASDLLVLAVKPQAMTGLLAEIKDVVDKRHLIVSIAAGVLLYQLEEGLGVDRRIVRVMPNTPCLVGASAAAFCPNLQATPEDADLVQCLLDTVGKAYRLPEEHFDAVTGLSGSGPAFVYVIINALSDGGVRMGLPRDVATTLAAQTVFGAAKMVLETGTHPEVLKDAVASPGGTTIAGLHALERGMVRAALMDAVEAATNRSAEMAAGGS